jgi:DNA-binding NtrC family response regulator
MEKVGILIIDNDEASQSAMRQILDSDGWIVRIVGQADHALGELSSGAWSLVVANIATTGLSGISACSSNGSRQNARPGFIRRA